MPVTSYLCQWKVPKKWKESNLHDYRKQKRRSSSSAVYWLGIKIFCEGKSSLFLFQLSLIVFTVIRWVSLCFLTHSTATKPFQLLNEESQTHHRWRKLSQHSRVASKYLLKSYGKSNRIPESSDSPLFGFQSAVTTQQLRALVRFFVASLKPLLMHLFWVFAASFLLHCCNKLVNRKWAPSYPGLSDLSTPAG